MARTKGNLRMADRLAGGKLTDELARYRRAGIGWAGIARLLRDDFGIEVTEKTLQAWAIELGVEVEHIEAAS